ncbi:MAG TPA: metalloregulator ArsR/SmtB family transcription factor [Euzebyales bacterium]|nr:metalloregulator ArsR/SmtB family transcription factor [Euzebyales bacterium]
MNVAGSTSSAQVSRRADEALRAIANPVRRRILHLTWDAEQPSAALADGLGLSRSATSQHLKVLRDADLVAVRPRGTQRLYRVRADTLEWLRRFLDDFWAPRLDRLKAAAEAEARGGTPAPGHHPATGRPAVGDHPTAGDRPAAGDRREDAT